MPLRLDYIAFYSVTSVVEFHIDHNGNSGLDSTMASTIQGSSRVHPE